MFAKHFLLAFYWTLNPAGFKLHRVLFFSNHCFKTCSIKLLLPKTLWHLQQMPIFWSFQIVKDILQCHPLQIIIDFKCPSPPLHPGTGLRHRCGQKDGASIDAFAYPCVFWVPSMLQTERQSSQRKQKCFHLPVALVISDLHSSSHPNITLLGRQTPHDSLESPLGDIFIAWQSLIENELQ